VNTSCETKTGFSALALLILLGVAGCGSSSSPSIPGNTYSTTSNKGDYSEWTLSDDDLAATWEVVNDTGGIDYTYDIAARCGSADVNTIRSCTIDSATCTDGLAVCPTPLPSGTIAVMEVPGVALLVRTTDDNGGDQLHAGFVKSDSACTDDVGGDYTFIRTGVGLDELFGLFRVDSNMLDVLHADFGFDTTATSSAVYTSQTVAYRSGDESETLTDGGCSNGLRLRTNGAGETIRAMMTASGLYVLDLPAGQGGALAFNVNNAASLSDFENKSFAGYSFPDNAPPQAFNATSGSIVSGKIEMNASLAGGTTLDIMNLTTPSGLTDPAYADFTAVPAGYGSTVLADDYPAPKDIPGLFKIGRLADKGRVLLAAMKFNDTLIAMGMVYNFRDTSDTDPSTGSPFVNPGLYNTGNFILFEK